MISLKSVDNVDWQDNHITAQLKYEQFGSQKSIFEHICQHIDYCPIHIHYLFVWNIPQQMIINGFGIENISTNGTNNPISQSVSFYINNYALFKLDSFLLKSLGRQFHNYIYVPIDCLENNCLNQKFKKKYDTLVIKNNKYIKNYTLSMELNSIETNVFFTNIYMMQYNNKLITGIGYINLSSWIE